MENLNDVITCQNLPQIIFELAGEGIYAKQIKDVTVIFKAELEEGDWLALDKTLAIETEHWRWIACQDLMT